MGPKIDHQVSLKTRNFSNFSHEVTEHKEFQLIQMIFFFFWNNIALKLWGQKVPKMDPN